MKEGAAWFGWNSDRREAPINFIPTTLFNNPIHEYVLRTSEDSYFADVNWEIMLEHLWPIELNYSHSRGRRGEKSSRTCIVQEASRRSK
eukprot:3266709-Amphidinium_carterae.1